MKQIADLHTHTLFSDGKLSPEELLAKAVDSGLSAISVTDHDTIDGCLYIQKIIDDYPIRFVNGIELSSHEKGREIHILGYGFDINNSRLTWHLKDYRKARFDRALKICQKLNSLGMEFDFEHIIIQAGKAPIGRPHIAEVLLKLGFVKNYSAAFFAYLSEDAPAYEPKKNFPVKDAIKLINDAGGVAVVAHPSYYNNQNLLLKIIEHGVDGIEVIHPSHSKEMQKYFRGIASQYSLLETGGSDFHGMRDYDDNNFAKYVVPSDVVDSINLRTRSNIV